MRYNIFLSTHQVKDNLFSNLKRKMAFYKTLSTTFQKNNIYGATISKTVGFYEGVREKSYMLQIICDKSKNDMIALCGELRAINNQDSVLLQIVSENLLVYADKIETL